MEYCDHSFCESSSSCIQDIPGLWRQFKISTRRDFLTCNLGNDFHHSSLVYSRFLANERPLADFRHVKLILFLPQVLIWTEIVRAIYPDQERHLNYPLVDINRPRAVGDISILNLHLRLLLKHQHLLSRSV